MKPFKSSHWVSLNEIVDTFCATIADDLNLSTSRYSSTEVLNAKLATNNKESSPKEA